MAVLLSPLGGVAAQFFDSNGNPLAGGKIYSYAAGTSTPQATYTTAAGNIQHSNPIQLDAAGRVPTGEIWLIAGDSYKFVIKDSNDVLIASYDNIFGIGNVNVVNHTGNGSQTTFANPSVSDYVINIFINGVYQNRNTYTVNSTNIVFSEAPPLNTIIEIQY